MDPKLLEGLPERFRKAADEAVSLFVFFEKKTGVNYAPVFTALLGVLDEAAKALLVQRLLPKMPATAPEQKAWFDPYLGGLDPRLHRHYQETARNLRKTLVYQSGVSPLGLLRNCLDFALNDSAKLTGVFDAIRDGFRFKGGRDLLADASTINDFRNTRVAHQERELKDAVEAKAALGVWIRGLRRLRDAQAA